MTGGKSLTITIPEIPPSNNKYMGKNKSHFIYHKDKEHWQELIYWAAFGREKQDPLQRARVTLTYHFKTKVRRDPDNYSGKFILDGLKAAGVIADDSFSNVELVIMAGEPDSKNPRTVILVDELKGAK